MPAEERALALTAMGIMGGAFPLHVVSPRRAVNRAVQHNAHTEQVRPEEAAPHAGDQDNNT